MIDYSNCHAQITPIDFVSVSFELINIAFVYFLVSNIGFKNLLIILREVFSLSSFGMAFCNNVHNS
jgi:hypothetical protein